MATTKKKEAAPATRVRVKDVRLAYADTLIKAKAFEAGAPEKFGGTFVMLPGHSAVELIEAAVMAAVTARWGDDKKKWPKRIRGLHFDPIVKDAADYPQMGTFPAGTSFVRASSQDAPGIVDADRDPAQDLRAEVYSGRWANVTFNAFTYERVTGSGVSLGLGNVQLMRHDTRLGTARPKPEEDFDIEELPDADNNDDEDGEDFVPTPRRQRWGAHTSPLHRRGRPPGRPFLLCGGRSSIWRPDRQSTCATCQTEFTVCTRAHR
jgi:hypothetical protein